MNNYLQVLILALLAISSKAYRSGYSPLKTEYEWKYFDYVWDSPEQRASYLENGEYDPKAMTPIDVDRSNDGRTFVTVIRSKGVPASVHTVSNQRTEAGPLLKPYPDWSWYATDNNCNGIINVYQVAIDRCNRIWVLDTGLYNGERVCPAQLLAFNLENDELILQKKIPAEVGQNVNGTGQLITPIVETSGEFCQQTTVYMADVSGMGLVVYDGFDFFRLESEVYAPDERYVNYTIAGENFTQADGVLGMALSPPQWPRNKRSLYFRPLASLSVYATDTQSIKLSKQGNAEVQYDQGVNVLPSQASAMAFSRDGVLLFGLTRKIAIGCWNMRDPMQQRYFGIALADKERLQFASGMKALTRGNRYSYRGEELLVMTNRLQKIYSGSQSLEEINFRILRGSISDLVEGTVCDKRQHQPPHGPPHRPPPHGPPHGSFHGPPHGHFHGPPHRPHYHY